MTAPRLTRRALVAGAALAAPALRTRPARAEDTLKLAVGQRGNWEQSVPELGQGAGFFRKRGLVLDILYTDGGGQTQQAVISGSVDIGTGVGTYGVMGAFGKGAPLRVIGNGTTGANDLYWYVRADSPIHTMRDAAGKSVGYSTTGSSTNLVVLGFKKAFGVDLQPVATGNPAATFTQVMSGQVDVGWASPPFGLDALDQGRTRIVARGGDVPLFAGQSVRVIIANARMLAQRADAVARFAQAYRESLDWMYSDPAALDAYAKFAGIPPELTKRARDGFYPKTNLELDRVEGMEALMKDAVEFKYLSAPLRPDQLAALVQVPKPLA